MKKVLNAILILAMLFSMFGCAEAPSPDPSQIDSNSHPNSEGVFPPELEPVGISQEEASERGGLFVKTAENRYLPLQNNIDIGANCILRHTAAVGAVVQRPLCGLSSGRN